MKALRRDSKQTQRRLLDAAGVVFARKGYRAATIAEICKRAKANVASVNYHFGTKKKLYAEAWRHEFHKAIEAHPPDGGVPPDAPVEKRLEGRVRALLQRILDPACRSFDIFHKEIAAPTGLLAQVKRESIEPIRQGLAALVREILGPAASEEDVGYCQMSILSQCLGPMIPVRRHKMGTGPAPPHGLSPEEPDFEALADHISRFCLAGLREVRERIRQDAKRRKKRLP